MSFIPPLFHFPTFSIPLSHRLSTPGVPFRSVYPLLYFAGVGPSGGGGFPRPGPAGVGGGRPLLRVPSPFGTEEEEGHSLEG